MDIIVTAGPIPAQLDSVKLITNKFRGGLALKTADMLASRGHNVGVVMWEGSPQASDHLVIATVRDVMDYYDAMREYKADTYVLAAAVANIMPAVPIIGKFPSHKYTEDDTFDIKFQLVPRIINRMREWHPNSVLIGYKLFDEDGLLAAGHEVLRGSGAHVVFCNTPGTAATKKIALTQSGAAIEQTFEEHVDFIAQAAGLQYYKTNAAEYIVDMPCPVDTQLRDLLRMLTVSQRGHDYGTVAFRGPVRSFWTTQRNKQAKDGAFVYVKYVDFDGRVVHTVEDRATMNAPFLADMFNKFRRKDYDVILHGHWQVPGFPTVPYAFPGTDDEYDTWRLAGGPACFNVEHHGFYAMFDYTTTAANWLRAQVR